MVRTGPHSRGSYQTSTTLTTIDLDTLARTLRNMAIANEPSPNECTLPNTIVTLCCVCSPFSQSLDILKIVISASGKGFLDNSRETYMEILKPWTPDSIDQLLKT